VQLRFGYGYSFSNSRRNDFTATKSVDSIVAHYTSTSTIVGVYDPFFTPDEQHIHSALATLKLNPSGHIEIGANAGIGFYAYTQNPYLFLNKNTSNELYIDKGASREGFVPVDAGAYVEYRFAKKYSLRADYKYRSTYFYSSHTAGLSFKMSIWKS
jgi:hypothetical protein